MKGIPVQSKDYHSTQTIQTLYLMEEGHLLKNLLLDVFSKLSLLKSVMINLK